MSQLEAGSSSLEFSASAAGTVLTARQILPRSLGEVFSFFADAANLELLTPAFLNFRILSPQPIEMRGGTLIDYRLSVHGIPLKWTSLISVWEPPYKFVDIQVRGPYLFWHHEHRFEETHASARSTCTVVTDTVRYRVFAEPLLGKWIQRDLSRIFEFRAEQLRKRFPGASASSSL